MMGEVIACTCWMHDIPDDAALTMLSIPGTHHSGSVDGPLGFAKTQDLGLSDQLEAGIRFLDIRLAHHQDNLCVHHDVVCMKTSYAEVLTICADFLGQHPSETILLSVSNEDRADSALGKFAPSQVLCKLSETVNPGENTRSFEDSFRAITWEQLKDAPLFYNFTAGPPGGDAIRAHPAFTSETTLGDVRGKIVLLRRFEGGQDIGFDVTYWPENQHFRSDSTPSYDVEDRYQNPGDDKFDFIVAHLEQATHGDPEDLYITFSSAVHLTARGYAETINPRLNDYLTESPRGRVGIIVMDYFEQPHELVANVIRTNATTLSVCSERSGGRSRLMTRDANIAAQEKAAQHLNAGDLDAFVDTLFAQDCVDHDPALGQGPGREGFRSFFRTLTTAFPDAQVEPAILVADDEHVSLAYTLTGTHRGDFHGVAATGKRIEVRGLQIGRFRDGRIVERWGSTDELGIMQQIGASPSSDSVKPGVLGKVADAFRS